MATAIQTIREKFVEALPDMLTTYGELIAKNLSENKQDILETSTGTVGILLKVFGKPLLDKYEAKKSEEKRANFGLEAYFMSAQLQIDQSMGTIDELREAKYTAEQVLAVAEEQNVKSLDAITADELVMVFQPKYHPAIQLVRKNQENIFRSLGIRESVIERFVKHFNTQISETVEKTFGNDYSAHLEEIKAYIRDEAELNLLMQLIEADRIGFHASEKMTYEQTFGKWKPTHSVNNPNQNQEEDTENEKSLRPVEELVDEYFEKGERDALERILFVIADFGKGKTVFMKHYAALLARRYINTREGYFPIYFNLRAYTEYKSTERLGVIANYLKKVYGFDIEKHTHKYIFLIDSLDESGELNKPAIDAVIASVKKIQNIDETQHRHNRILITSRPIAECLEEHLERHHPHCIKNEDERDIEHYISIYGFKKEQFNNWLMQSLKNNECCPKASDVPFVQKILKGIEAGETVDVYSELLKGKSLAKSELQRPIFAYMIYQLILNKIDFLKVGKIGIYLSFLNFLSKDAKHVNDPLCEVNLLDELGFRNLLHATGALWMQQRHKGKQAALKMADICRVLKPEDRDKEDKQLLDNSDITDIQFLSHSYFGEKDNILHFQHQSFAEILLAEYYLKIIIKYALDKKTNIHEARAKLMLGIPTEQSVLFFKDLLLLLKDTVSEEATDEVIEKRKLLFPLMASLAIEKNNTLLSENLDLTWLDKYTITDRDATPPRILLNGWCINQTHIDKILQLAKEIVNASDSFVLAKAEVQTNLIGAEVLLFSNRELYTNSTSMDKWLALLVGNTLCNDTSDAEQPVLFNTTYQISYTQLFDLLAEKMPFQFMGQLFMGIDMRENKQMIEVDRNLYHVNFSFSYLENINFRGKLYGVNFKQSVFGNVCFIDNILAHTSFYKTELKYIHFLESHLRFCAFDELKEGSMIYSEDMFYDSVFLPEISGLFEDDVDEYINWHGKVFIPFRLSEEKFEDYNPYN
ncbi:MAG: hypothetical protein RL662_417, partial [Bacteroidota bacterium]